MKAIRAELKAVPSDVSEVILVLECPSMKQRCTATLMRSPDDAWGWAPTDSKLRCVSYFGKVEWNVLSVYATATGGMVKVNQ